MDFFFEGHWRLDWWLGNPNKTAVLIAGLMVASWSLAFVRKWGFWTGALRRCSQGMVREDPSITSRLEIWQASAHQHPTSSTIGTRILFRYPVLSAKIAIF